MVVGPSPRAALEMIQAQLFLHLLISPLHRPPAPPQHDAAPPRGVLRHVGKRVPDLPIGLSLDREPMRLGPRAIPRRPAIRRPSPLPAEPPRQIPLGPSPPRHPLAGQ